MEWLNSFRLTGVLALGLGVALFALIPHHVTVEPIPGASQYVSFTPAAVPRICATAFCAIGALLLLVPTRETRTAARPVRWRSGLAGTGHVVLVLVLLGAYTAALGVLGYVASTIVLLLVLNLYAGTGGLVRLVSASVVLPLVLYYFFGRVMLIPLPDGSLFG